MSFNAISKYRIKVFFVLIIPIASMILFQNFTDATLTKQSQKINSPFGWTLHLTDYNDKNWNKSSEIAKLVSQSGAGWIRDSFLLGDKIGTLGPIAYQSSAILLPIKDSLGRNVYLPKDVIQGYVDLLKPFITNKQNIIVAILGYSTEVKTNDGKAVIKNAYGAVTAHLLKALVREFPTNPGEIVFEFHNEPNERGSYMSPELYVLGLKELSQFIAATGTNTKLLATLSHFGIDYNSTPVEPFGYLKKILDHGAINYIQGFAAHPYRGLGRPEQAFTLLDFGQILAIGVKEKPVLSDSEGFFKEISQWTSFIQGYNKKKKSLDIHFTEIGYSSAPLLSGYAAVETEARQGRYLSRLLTQLFHLHVLQNSGNASGILNGMIFRSVEWYDLKDDDETYVSQLEAHFGAVTKDFSRVKPAFNYFSYLSKLLGNPADYRKWNGSYSIKSLKGSTPLIKSFAWQNSKGLIIPFWTTTRNNIAMPAHVNVDLQENKFARVTLYDPTENLSYRLNYSWVSGTKEINIPVIVPNHSLFLVIETSMEAAESYVKENYQEFFGTVPEPDGLAYWSNALISGKFTPEEYRKHYLSQSDPQSLPLFLRESAFISDLYQEIYGSKVDKEGLTYWVNRLTVGDQNNPPQSRDQIKQLLLENKLRGASAMEQIFDLQYELYGQSDEAGARYWTSKILNESWTLEMVRARFLNDIKINDAGLRSREDAFLQRLYVMSHWGDWQSEKKKNPGILDYWMEVLISGKDGKPPKSQDQIWAENGFH